MKNKNILKVALVQMASGDNEKRNMRKAIELLKQAVEGGAQLVCFPEVFNYRARSSRGGDHATTIPGPLFLPLQEYARQKQIWILAGSVREKAAEFRKVYNSSVVIGNDGNINAIYRKIHLFDAQVNGKKVLESATFMRGKDPVLADVAGIPTGLSICYDLRFPELYREYSAQGAKMLYVPSSFTAVTGKAHWEILLRARAIENQCFVLAPNQYGIGSDGVRTYGNSMIIDPWGEILARASKDRKDVIYGVLDFNRLNTIRNILPALKHRVL